jgi:hypothetical protein
LMGQPKRKRYYFLFWHLNVFIFRVNHSTNCSLMKWKKACTQSVC